MGDQRRDLKAVLDRGESWLRDVETGPDLSYDPPRLRDDILAVRKLGMRADSDLLNVAMFGSSSAGKTFLACGIQGGLEFLRVESVEGVTSDKYLGLLPFSTTPTTMCPASITPIARGSGIDAQGRGFMRVRFIDSGEELWEDVGNTPAPAVVAAYAMFKADVTNRLRQHMNRDVAEIEILFSDYAIPVKLYDLPGYGTVNPNHEMIARQAISAADCFIYVANASRALTTNAKDLELIRFLYEHHILTRKRIVWVLTGIDKAMDLNLDNEPSWKESLAANNEYLRQNFTLQDGSPDIAFIGPGFIPVSPALEAQGRYYMSRRGEGAQGQTLLAAGKMEELRRTLTMIIEEGVGQRHLSDIAAEAIALIGIRQRVIKGRLTAERVPFDELTAERSAIEEQLESLDQITAEIKDHLEAILAQRVRTSTRPFTKLAAYLHENLDGEIRSADIRNSREANKIEVHKSQVVSSWMTAPNGPASKWDAEFSSLEQAAVSYVHSKLGKDGVESKLTEPPPLEIDLLTAPKAVRRQVTTSDVMKNTAAFVTAATPVSAGVTWATSALAFSAIAWPAAALTAAGALTFATISAIRSRRSSLNAQRQELIDDIDQEAIKYRTTFTDAIAARGQLVIENILDYLAEYRGDLERHLETIRRRVNEPENVSRLQLIAQLEPLAQTADELAALLRQLADVQT